MVKMRRSRALLGILAGLCCVAAFVGPALAQTPAGDACEVPREASGLIRGDRVPTGCVMTERRAAPAPDVEPAVVFGHTVVLVPVLVGSGKLFLSDPPFIGVPPGPGAAADAEDLPRVRPGAFGPILHPFGPVTQPFRPTNTSFERAAPGAGVSSAGGSIRSGSAVSRTP